MSMIKRLLENYVEAMHPGDYDSQDELMDNICDGSVQVPLEEMSRVVNQRQNPMNPTVGMGATECVGSDRYPYTVILVVSPKKIVVRRDDYKRIDNNGISEQQEYEYTPNPSGEEITLTFRKNGRWVPEGSPIKCGASWHIGQRRAYSDPSF